MVQTRPALDVVVAAERLVCACRDALTPSRPGERPAEPPHDAVVAFGRARGLRHGDAVVVVNGDHVGTLGTVIEEIHTLDDGRPRSVMIRRPHNARPFVVPVELVELDPLDALAAAFDVLEDAGRPARDRSNVEEHARQRRAGQPRTARTAPLT
jgi:hypothetical protein